MVDAGEQPDDVDMALEDPNESANATASQINEDSAINAAAPLDASLDIPASPEGPRKQKQANGRGRPRGKRARVSFGIGTKEDDASLQVSTSSRLDAEEERGAPNLNGDDQSTWAGFPSLWPVGHSPFIQTRAQVNGNKRKRASLEENEFQPEPITKDNLIIAREQIIQNTTNSHDAMVRELFHMDRYASMLQFDPVRAKQDKSQVWEDQFDLSAKLEPSLLQQSGGRASRKTRNDNRDSLGSATTSPSTLPKKKGAPRGRYASRAKAKDGDQEQSIVENAKISPTKLTFTFKGKGKETAEDTPEPSLDDGDLPDGDDLAGPATFSARGRGRPRGRPRGRGGRSSKGRRDSIKTEEVEEPAGEDASMEEDDFEISIPLHRHKAGPSERRPNSPPRPLVPDHRDAGISPFIAPLEELRSQFPAGSPRPGFVDPTHPDQRFPNVLAYNFGSVRANLDSYMVIEDITGTDERPRDLSSRMQKEAKTLDRISLYRNEGRMISSNPDRRARETEPLRSKEGDHYSRLVDQAVQMQKIMIEAKRVHLYNAKKIGQMVINHFEEQGGNEEIAQAVLERSLKMLAKNTMKEIRKRWKEVAVVIQQQNEIARREEAERKNKEHLQMILEQSTHFLSAQRDDFALNEELEINDEQDNQSDSDGTPAPSVDEDGESDPDEHDREVSTQPGDFSMPATPAADSDQEFGAANDSDRDVDDLVFMQEMEEEEDAKELAEDSDEDAGLLADAEMPIEELLRKYKGATSNSPKQGMANGATEVSELFSVQPFQGENEDANSRNPPKEIQTAKKADNEEDVEFTIDDDEKRDLSDVEHDIAMDIDEENSEDDDAAMKALAAEADAPLDSLLGGYDPMKEEQAIGDQHSGSAEVAEQSDNDLNDAVSASGHSDASSNTSQEQIKVRIPFLLRGTLRPYQKAGLEWLASLYTNGLSGILADEMGLGKTIQTIALLAWLACEKGDWGPHLIVVPTSVLLNWEMEFKKFFPGCKVLTYYGSVKERKDKRKGWNTPNTFHVVITSYQISLTDAHMLRRKSWHYLILDEAHNIKNFRSQRWQTLLGFNSRRRLLLTGTPLQNNLMELWSLLYFLMPAGWSTSGPFANHKEFQDWFSNPMDRAVESGEVNDEETRGTVSRLHTILRPYLLRRLKADVEKQMPGKYEHIIYCRLSKRQRFLYDEFMSRASTRETLNSGSFMNIINCMMQLRKVCNHPDLFEVRPIVTSFSLNKAVETDYSSRELLVRSRLLGDLDSVPSYLSATGSATSVYAGMATRRWNASRKLANYLLPERPTTKHPIDVRTAAGWQAYLKQQAYEKALVKAESFVALNDLRCDQRSPLCGVETQNLLAGILRSRPPGTDANDEAKVMKQDQLARLKMSLPERAAAMEDAIRKFAFVTPAVIAQNMSEIALAPLSRESVYDALEEDATDCLHLASTKLSIAFPDSSLIQYDCGKLQQLDILLRKFKEDGSRVLIFTQMTKVLDLLEIFLSYHGHRYLRLDGSTKVEDRQLLTERFNRDSRVLAFISSTRAGGLGINLTGANAVVFYDSDWNPAMDRQCQDRCHRIGQTRDVHIYRFVCESTIEENMLRKANQKRMLDRMVIAEGDFTTEFFTRLDWRGMLDDGANSNGASTPAGTQEPAGPIDMNDAFRMAEDEEDQAAARIAEDELAMDQEDFDEPGKSGPPAAAENTTGVEQVQPATAEVEEEDDLAGTIDGWMLKFLRLEEQDDLVEEL